MKTIQHLAITLLFLALIAFISRPQQDTLIGNGNVVEQVREVGSFDRITIGGIFQVYLSQGDQEQVKVVADENLHPVILTDNKGSHLRISMPNGVEIKKSKKLEVYVTLNNIDKLDISSVGNVATSSALQLENLDLSISSVGKTALALNCNQLDIQADMVGNVMLEGKANEVIIRNSGVGSLQAFDLEAKKLSIDNKGVGGAELYATDEISIHSRGVGQVKYKGEAVVKELEVSGIGKVKKI